MNTSPEKQYMSKMSLTKLPANNSQNTAIFKQSQFSLSLKEMDMSTPRQLYDKNSLNNLMFNESFEM